MRVLIIGGHGKIALQLSQLLSQAGSEVTSVIRKAEQSDDVAATGAQPLVLDVETSTVDQLAGAMAGHDAVVWSAGAGGGSAERTYAVDRDAAIRSMDAAEVAKVQRYVMVSYLGAGPDHGVEPGNSFFAYAEAKADADEHLRNTALDWTILAPGALTDVVPSGTITTSPVAGQRETARGNVALVAAAVLQAPETVHQTISFTDGGTAVSAAISGTVR